jgi:hypothetical protein
MTACAVDEQSTTADNSAATVAAPETYNAIKVPPELSLAQLDGTIQGNEFTGTTNACHVNLLFCADPRTSPPFNPPLPSYCSNGCTASQAFSAAASLCRSVCGHIDCSVLANFGGC